MGFVDRLKGMLHLGKTPMPASPEGSAAPAAPAMMETRTTITPAAAEAAVGASVAEGLNKPITAEILKKTAQEGTTVTTTTLTEQPTSPVPAETKG